MELLWCFFAYSLMGFCLEVAFARAVRCPKRDRKCLYLLPLCPVYGLGAVLILLLPPALRNTPLLLIPSAALIATAAEYIMALFYEKVWRVQFWNYAALPLNLHGRVCLQFSAAWALLALPLVYWVQPWLSRIVASLPPALLLALLLLFLTDTVLTGLVLRKAGDTRALIWYRRPVSHP